MIALIAEAAVIERILRHLGVPTEIPAPRPAPEAGSSLCRHASTIRLASFSRQYDRPTNAARSPVLRICHPLTIASISQY